MLSEGALLGARYEIQSSLGKGGMGVVYKAYDRVLDEMVAIKVLLRRDDVDAGTERRFRSEIKLARKVTHRNVCRIHDYGEDGGVQYISMQLLEGTDLRERLRARGGLPAQEACETAFQIAAGLQAIHDEGIVHRDLKTANVMIDTQGVARLMDFGIAKSSEGGESLTGTGVIVGTPEYMSPEQIHAQELDARSDVYALGVILFELFTGRVPFTAGTAVALLMKHLHEEPPLDDAAAAAIPPAVRPVIRKALAKEREARYGSARELADALHAALAAAPPTQPLDGSAAIRPPSVPSGRVVTTERPKGRRKWPLGLAAGLILLSAIGWAAVRALVRPAPPVPSPSSAPSFAPTTTAVTPAPPALVSRGTVTPPSAAPLGLPAATRGCDEGQGAACVAAGQRYEAGDGVPQDERRAAALYRRACDRGAAAGCTLLGVLHNRGRGVEKDVAAAAELYEKGCAAGDGSGCNNLGTLYEFGVIGLGRDETLAAQHYRRGCDLGDPAACGNLGLVSLSDALPGPRRDGAISLLRQGCAGGAARACRKLQELGLSP